MLYFWAVLGPYNFCNAEKMDGIANFNNKNVINVNAIYKNHGFPCHCKHFLTRDVPNFTNV